MKKLIILLSVLISLSCTAQNVKMDSKGNYTAITAQKDSAAYKTTGKTYTDSKGIIYDVYVSEKNKLFVKKISKAGNSYKMYLKTEK